MTIPLNIVLIKVFRTPQHLSCTVCKIILHTCSLMSCCQPTFTHQLHLHDSLTETSRIFSRTSQNVNAFDSDLYLPFRFPSLMVKQINSSCLRDSGHFSRTALNLEAQYKERGYLQSADNFL